MFITVVNIVVVAAPYFFCPSRSKILQLSLLWLELGRKTVVVNLSGWGFFKTALCTKTTDLRQMSPDSPTPLNPTLQSLEARKFTRASLCAITLHENHNLPVIAFSFSSSAAFDGGHSGPQFGGWHKAGRQFHGGQHPWHPHCSRGRRESGRLSRPCSCLVAGGTTCCLRG